MTSVAKEVRGDQLGWFECSVQPAPSTTACSFVDTPSDATWRGLEYLLARMETIVFRAATICCRLGGCKVAF